MDTVKRGLCWKINWNFFYKKCSSFQSHGLIEQPSYIIKCCSIYWLNKLNFWHGKYKSSSARQIWLILENTRVMVNKLIALKSFRVF